MSTVDKVRSWDRLASSIRDFHSWMEENGAPGGMDIDFICERRGKFLVIEAKPWVNGVTMRKGQHLALVSLSKLEQMEVWLVAEPRDNSSLYIHRYSPTTKPPLTADRRQFFYPASMFAASSREQLSADVNKWWAAAGAR